MTTHKVGIYRVGKPARTIFLGERSARALVRTGKFAYDQPAAPTPVPPKPAPAASDGLDALSYWELHRRVQELPEEQRPEGRSKADYLIALRGSYLRRDMRAED